MRTLVFDGRMGASGNMLLGALIAAGAKRERLGTIETDIDIEFAVEETDRCSIAATGVDVHSPGRTSTTDQTGTVQDGAATHASHRAEEHPHEHDHDHGHEHDHGHGHSTGDSHGHAEGGGPLRTYPEVVDIVEGMGLPGGVQNDAIAIFRLLGEAEASVHGTDIEETHFHEVGADDAIADIVGACLLVDSLDVERVVTTPLATGGGTVRMSHGTYPVPAPAVVELSENADWSVRGGPVETELLTPTGAAIMAHLAAGTDHLPSLAIDASGYGAGDKRFPEHPNVLRALVGRTDGGLQQDSITVLETNLDDASPEELGGLQKTLVEAGALDVTVLPATMKKSRPGHLVKVVVKPENAKRVARKLAIETGTLGVREHGAGHRWIAEREMRSAEIELADATYEIDVKVARSGGELYDVSAEYDDALTVATETEHPIREITRRAEAAVRDQL